MTAPKAIGAPMVGEARSAAVYRLRHMNQAPNNRREQYMLEPQLFAIVDATDHNSVYCYGVDTGDGAFTYRRDAYTGHSTTGHSTSMYSAFALANRIVRGQARFDLVIYKSVEDEMLEYKEGFCPACNNERQVSVDLDNIFPPDVARYTRWHHSVPGVHRRAWQRSWLGGVAMLDGAKTMG